MSDDLRTRFLPQFLATARARLARMRTCVGQKDVHGLAFELHALGGEATVLDMDSVAKLVQEAETLARAEDFEEEAWTAFLSRLEVFLTLA